MPINMFEPRTMRQAIEIMPSVHTFLTGLLIKQRNTSPTETVDVDIVKGTRKLAPFVHPKRGGKVITDEGYETKSFKPPLAAPMFVTDADKLAQRLPGESLYGGVSPEERAQKRLGRDLSRQDEMLTRLEEWMLAMLIFTGQIPLKGEGLEQVMAFGFTNHETLTGTDLWSDANADPITKLKEKVRLINKIGFAQATHVIMALDAADAFISHPKVKDQLDNRRITLGQIDPTKLPNGVTYLGNLKETGLELYSYEEYYLDEITDPANPTTQPLVPDGKIAIVSTHANFSLEYGAITKIDEETGNWHTYEDVRVPDSWIEKNPDRRMLKTSARPLPVPHQVNSWYTMDVL